MDINKIKEICNSNEFWMLGPGDHLNMIDILLEYIEKLETELEKNE